MHPAPPPPDVVVARGSSEAELIRAARVLDDHAVPFEVEERVGGSPERPQWLWELKVAVGDLDRARAVLAGGPEPAREGPPPGPLFDSRGPEALRVLAVLVSLGLAGGLWLRSCLS